MSNINKEILLNIKEKDLSFYIYKIKGISISDLHKLKYLLRKILVDLIIVFIAFIYVYGKIKKLMIYMLIIKK